MDFIALLLGILGPIGFWIGLLLFIFGIWFVLGGGILIVKQKNALVLETFGKYAGTRRAGLQFKLPAPITHVAGTINLKIKELSEDIGVKSADNAFLLVPVKVQFQVDENNIEGAFYELANPDEQILSYIVNIVRSKANDMTMDEIFRSKDDFENSVEIELNAQFRTYGYKIINVLVDDPQPSKELKAAFDRVLAAKRDQEASELEKVAIRNRIVGKAEAEADSLVLKAKAFVDMRKVMAKGNSDAIKEFGEDLELSHVEILRYFEGLDMRDAIRDAAGEPGSLVIITPGTASDNQADLAQIAALAGKIDSTN